MRALLANSSRKISSSSMRPRVVLAVFFLILVVALLLDDVSGGRGSRRGGRSSRGGSSGGRRTSFRSSRRSRSSSRRHSSQYGPDSPSKPRITKFTPIKPTTFRTPVIAKQTKLGSHAKLFTGVVAGYLVTKYLLRNAPVYRGGFPVYGSYVSIPQNRAVRLSSERVSLLDSNGNLCLGRSTQKRTLKEGIEDNIIELNTTVNYTASPGNVTTLYGVNSTVSLEDIKEQNFTVTTRARYNVTVVDNSDCTQVEKEVNGTMVQLFEFNPNRENTANINTKLLISSITLFGILNKFKLA